NRIAVASSGALDECFLRHPRREAPVPSPSPSLFKALPTLVNYAPVDGFRHGKVVDHPLATTKASPAKSGTRSAKFGAWLLSAKLTDYTILVIAEIRRSKPARAGPLPPSIMGYAADS